MSQKIVQEKLDYISLYDLHGPFDKTIDYLIKLKEQHKGKKVTINVSNCSHDDGQEYVLVWERPENDTEIAKRLKYEADSKEWRKKQYENLKKEFE